MINQPDTTIDSEASQARCYNLPNDAPEGHYWSWVQAPKSIPTHYRHCMICDRIDASEWAAQEANKARIDELRMLQDIYKNELKFTHRDESELRSYTQHRIAQLTAEKGSNNG